MVFFFLSLRFLPLLLLSCCGRPFSLSFSGRQLVPGRDARVPGWAREKAARRRRLALSRRVSLLPLPLYSHCAPSLRLAGVALLPCPAPERKRAHITPALRRRRTAAVRPLGRPPASLHLPYTSPCTVSHPAPPLSPSPPPSPTVSPCLWLVPPQPSGPWARPFQLDRHARVPPHSCRVARGARFHHSGTIQHPPRVVAPLGCWLQPPPSRLPPRHRTPHSAPAAGPTLCSDGGGARGERA